ncbi:hypothetical protein ACPXCP_05700 [Streptomyces sp. DT20]|uniref:hypothetical protein n=1 Tax=Streptomyces sp. DT20 TaxID=3416519 RepID=UPI003CEED9C5
MAAAPPTPLRTALPPESRGGLGLTQGRYGARGNLELMLCDERDGLWVLWFNCDPETAAPDPGGPPPGEWSGGLRFATGHRYDEVTVVQSGHGPHHLEIVARSGATPHRLRWSPEAAFTVEAPPPGGAASSVAEAEGPDGVLWVGALGVDGVPRLFRADTTAYPRLTWREEPAAPSRRVDGLWNGMLLLPGSGGERPGIVLTGAAAGTYLGPSGAPHPLPGAETAAAVTGPDGEPLVYLWTGGPWLDVLRPGHSGDGRRLPLPGSGRVTALAATALAHAEGSTDLVVRRGGQLWHLRDPGPGGTASATPVVSRLSATATGEPRPVHRCS